MTTILHVIWGLEAGGKERFLYRLVRGLDARQFKHEVLTLRARGVFYDKLAAEGYHMDCLNKRPGMDPRALCAIHHHIHTRRPDIIHVQDFTSAFATLATARFRRQLPVVFTLHGGQIDLPWAKQILLRRVLRRASAVTAVSNAMIAALHGQAASILPIRNIPLGIDMQAFERPAGRSQLREELGIPSDGPLVVSVMRLDEPKDPWLVLRAAQRITRRHPDCRFLLVGDGRQRPALHSLLAQLGLEHHVFFAGYRTDIPELLALANICVLASKREGLPFSILEYMAAGKPVVATRVGGVEELVEDGATGYLVEAGAETELADRIMALLRDPQRAGAFGAAGRERVRAHFQECTMIAAYETLYTQLTARTWIG